jgi:uncharacterized cupredoxin-like copper-binding protein
LKTAIRLSLAAVPLAAILACGGGSTATNTPGGGGSTVAAQEKEFSITLDKTTVSPGSLTFNIANGGTIEHEFVVIDTDTPAAQLPQADGEADEDQLEVVDEAEDIAAGGNATLTVDLDPGHYAIICNVPGHYSAGMHVDLTVQ